ncbi:hypothetical protein M3649_04055 [Ureibacillus chungkukjangi]|uniref:hypothetical protein n=1 Tax=Ureibacillus chungkukjangi TaxID=1202712 RepID=UPI00203A61B0|nr:hypothetical protein [Ureibacillus chungkukjangi]MCM3387306.1 hypothetical protein [Ureibacillus chungkukjangi]
MKLTVNTLDVRELELNIFFSEMEELDRQIEAENNTTYEPTLEEIIEIETDLKWFNHFVEIGLIELV